MSRKILTVEELENQITDFIEEITISDKFMKVASAIIESNTELLRAQGEKIEEMQKKELAIIEREIKNLLQMRVNELVTDEEYMHEKQIRENKKALLIQRINENESNPLSTLANMKSLLLNLVSLKDRFIKASAEGRKTIFSGIGENYQLFGKKLNIIKPLWLETVAKNKKEAEAEISLFELEKYIDLKSFSVYFKDMFPVMSALLEEVGTVITKGIEAKRPFQPVRNSNE
jgi:hypothetical protein